MTLREYIFKEGLKKCPECGEALKDCKCAKDFGKGKKKSKKEEVCPDCGKPMSKCACKDFNESEELDESLGLAMGLGIAAGLATAAGIIKHFKLKKWQEAKKKTSYIRLASAEIFQEDVVISLIDDVNDGTILTRLIPTKSLLEKYFSEEKDKHDFDGFIKELESVLNKRYEDLAKIFNDSANRVLVDSIDKAEAEFYCYLVKFSTDEKKKIKEVVENATKKSGFKKDFKVKIMVEKK